MLGKWRTAQCPELPLPLTLISWNCHLNGYSRKKNWVDTSDLSELEALPDSEKRLCTSTPPHRLYPSVLIYSLIPPFTHRLLPTADGQLCLLVPNDAKWFYYMDRCPLAGRKGFAKPFLSLYLQKKIFWTWIFWAKRLKLKHIQCPNSVSKFWLRTTWLKAIMDNVTFYILSLGWQICSRAKTSTPPVFTRLAS